MSNITFNWQPYQKQIEFFNSTQRYIAFGGSRGGGKSWAARVKAILLALNYSGIQVLMLRRTLNELRENHILVMQIELKEVAKYSEMNKEFIFPNGSRIKLGYCAAESDVLQFQGQAYDVIFLEEATQFTEFQKDTLTECNRSSGLMKVKFTPRIYITCNPGGIGHSWVKRLFIDREYRNSEKPDNYKFIPSTVYENKFLMENNPEYVENLENLPEMRKRAMLYGDWDAFEGQFFSEFDREVHVIEPFVIPEHWHRYMTMDYGLDMLACYWIAVDTEGNSYIYKELYESDLIISDAADRIKKVNGNDKVKLRYAPPDLDNRRQETGKSVFDIFRENQILLVKSDNKRESGWLAMKEWLKVFESKDIQTGATIRASKMKIFKNCHNLIRCIPMAQTDETDANDIDDRVHELTHSCLTGDTIVNTVDGDIPIRELVGKQGMVYCYDETNKKKTISNYFDVRKTRENAPIIYIELEQGKSIKCTPDHSVLTDKGWVEAQYLTIDNSIINV